MFKVFSGILGKGLLDSLIKLQPKLHFKSLKTARHTNMGKLQ